MLNHLLQTASSRDEQRSARVPEIVKTDARQAARFDRRDEVPAPEVVVMDRSTFGRGEDVSVR